MKRLIGIFIFLNGWMAYGQTARMPVINFSTFTNREKSTSREVISLTSKEYLEHPEMGVKPFDAPPCSDCYEVIDKRDEYSRRFVTANTNGSEFYIQQSNSPLNYKDANGWWREINYRLEKKSEGLFVAEHQADPVIIDLQRKMISVTSNSNAIFSKTPVLIFKDDKGEEHLLGEVNLSDYTAGDEGVKIRNAYPGIDMVISVGRGMVETFFILNNKLPYKKGELIMRQEIATPDGFSFTSNGNVKEAMRQQIDIIDGNRVPQFQIDEGVAYDNASWSQPQHLSSKVSDGKNVDFIVPVSWLADPSTIYPVVIDPLIVTFNSLPVASIMGTRFGAFCWTNSCDYGMTVPTPGNTTITAILHSFEWRTSGLCFSDDGGYSIDFAGCHVPAVSPSFPDGVYTSLLHQAPFTFYADSTSPLPEFDGCFPPPQCAAQNLNFTLHFFRCHTDPNPACASNCIRATQPWIMYIKGRTLELSAITPTSQICEGANATLVVTPQYGVPPYSYVWTGGGTDDTLIVSPVVNSNYTVTITDACGVTASGTTAVNVTARDNPGFTVTPNPTCVNSSVTMNGNGAGSASFYDWLVPGSSATGGAVNDNQNPSVTYSLAGNYNVYLNYTSGTCTFTDSVTVTITTAGSATVTINATPAGAICQGDTVHFVATPVNGGAAPTYDWLIDGVNVQSGATDSLVTSALNNGSVVQAILHSNASCASPLDDTTALIVAVTSASAPQVSISPDTAVCSGSSVTLTASPTNGGTTPTYQWYANGIAIGGATSSTYTFNVTPPDTIISVQMNSSLNCLTATTDEDTSVVNILQNVQPAVTLSANPAGVICSGDSVYYTAQQTGGGSPTYQWFVNGIANAVTDSVFPFVPSNGDSISVTMTSSIPCVVTPADDDYTLASVSPAVSPSVSVAAAPSLSVCLNDTVTFTASAVNAGSGPVYSWTINGNPAGINDSILTSSTLSNNDVVQVIVTSSLSCAPIVSDTDAVTVSVTGNVPAAVSIVANPGGLCEGDPVQLIASGSNGGGAPAFQWLVNGVATGQTNDTIVLTTLNANDTVQAIMTSSLSCVSPATANSPVYISPLLQRVSPDILIIANPGDSICQGQQVVLNADTLNGGNAPQIRWYVNGIQTTVNTTTITSTTFVQGDVIVANMTSNASCLISPLDTSNFIRIHYYPPLSVQLLPVAPLCPGEPTTLTAIPSGGNGGPYSFTFNTGVSDSDSVFVTPGRNTELIVTVDDNCTAYDATDTITVPVLTGPVSDFSFVNPAPGSFEYNIQFINNSIDADNVLWIFPDSTTSTDLNPLHHFEERGTYDVTLITFNNSGCIDTVTYTVSVDEEVAFYYPNSFTPNGDGINELFSPLGGSLEDYEMIIFNRWGEVIYTGNSLMAWDGTIRNGKTLAPEGVYVFRIDLKSDRFEKRVVTGRITLIR